jgi:hypothetical protein
VLVSRAGNECGTGATLLDKRVGRQRGAMNQLVDMFDANTGDPDHLDQAIDNGLFGLAVIGQYFRAVLIRSDLEHDIGESPADISADADTVTIVAHG